MQGLLMGNKEHISLKDVSNILVGGTAVALGLVAAVWGVIGIFVL